MASFPRFARKTAAIGLLLFPVLAFAQSTDRGLPPNRRFHIIGCSTTSERQTVTTDADDPLNVPNVGRIGPGITNPNLAAALKEDCDAARSLYGVKAPMVIIEEEGGPNATATDLILSNSFPDGTVFFGVNLMNEEYRPQNGTGWGIPTIVGHEFAHILQKKRQFPVTETKWQELHADYLAGWFTGYRTRYRPSVPMLALTSLFKKGDYAFNSRGHHGTPQERVAAFQAGYSLNAAGVLDGSSAYARGLHYVQVQGAPIEKAEDEGDTGDAAIPFYIRKD